MAAQHGYTRDPNSCGDLDPGDMERLDDLLLRRNAARARRDWSYADALRTEMRHALGVEIFDGIKQWRTLADRLEGFPPLPGLKGHDGIVLVKQQSAGERRAAGLARNDQAEAEADIASIVGELAATHAAIAEHANHEPAGTPRSEKLQRQLEEAERERQNLFAQLEAQKADDYRYAASKKRNSGPGQHRQSLQPQRCGDENRQGHRANGQRQFGRSHQDRRKAKSSHKKSSHARAQTEMELGYGSWYPGSSNHEYYYRPPGQTDYPYHGQSGDAGHMYAGMVPPESQPSHYYYYPSQGSGPYGYAVYGDAPPQTFFAGRSAVDAVGDDPSHESRSCESVHQPAQQQDGQLEDSLRGVLGLPPPWPSPEASTIGTPGGLEALPRTPSGSIYSPAQLPVGTAA